MITEVSIAPSSTSCTSERSRVRSVEGKAVGLEWVVIFLAEVSGEVVSSVLSRQAGMLVPTLVLGTADFAGKITFATDVRLEQVAAVGAKDQGSDRGHCRLTCHSKSRACDFPSSHCNGLKRGRLGRLPENIL